MLESNFFLINLINYLFFKFYKHCLKVIKTILY